MKNIAIISFLACVALKSVAQANFVKNPSFEEYSKCPDDWNKIHYAKYWQNAIDSLMPYGMEYYNTCGNSSGDNALYVPNNGGFWQMPHTNNAMAGAVMFYNKTSPPPPIPLPFNYRDNLQGHLIKPLTNGKIYCVSFWINSAEATGYVHNKIGAYLDNGAINSIADTAGEEITSVTPQVFTNTIIEDTMNWVKIEGSFVATGNETHITIGNFFPNAAVSTKFPNYWNVYTQYSYYLIDDVSVIPIDLDINAGDDTYVPIGSKVKIGRTKDSTTAMGLDCKWYKKGVLIDSGAIISVNANSIINAVDTYVVVQNICGVIKRDTVNVKTTGLGISEMNFENAYSIFPNPSNGNFSITCFAIPKASITAKVYDLLGRVVHQEPLNFSNKEATLKLNIPSGSYILELKDEAGNVQRERIVIE
jgi:hypothetical protein